MRFRLAEARRRAGYRTQRELAEAFGTSRRNVEDWERGSRWPSLKTAVKLADFLGCDVGDLVERRREETK